jgi:hypothetical protein
MTANIHPNCRSCDKELSEKDLSFIQEQIDVLSYTPSQKFGSWHGLCQGCKDKQEPFVVS